MNEQLYILSSWVIWLLIDAQTSLVILLICLEVADLANLDQSKWPLRPLVQTKIIS